MAILLKHPNSFPGNPVDLVEEVLLAEGLVPERENAREMTATIDGSWNSYHLWYRWEEPMALLLFKCTVEMHLSPENSTKLYPLLARANEKLWLGHFELDHEQGDIVYRRNVMLDYAAYLNAEKVESLLDIAVTELDRFYPAIQAVLWQDKTADEALSMALFETAGEA